MKPLIYECPEAPANVRFMAVYLDAGKLLPVRHTGSSQEVVTERAEAWWAQQVEAARKRGAGAGRGKRKPAPQEIEEAI